MAAFLVLAAFAASLFLCIGLGGSVLPALIFGFVLFFLYGVYRGHTAKEMTSMALSGMNTVKNILITFVLIGMITAVWRAGGTIPFIVFHSIAICNSHVMVLLSFLLCCLISFLTGTSFGTAATMGVICVTVANTMGIPILYTGGAVLAGSYFGDRCSPMSTSALLISSLTGTDLFRNLYSMIKTSLVPFAATCVIYGAMGLGFDARCDVSGLQALFAGHFVLHPAVAVPAAVVILFSLFKVDVKLTMGTSILCAAACAVLIQGIAPAELLHMAVFGYQPENAEVAALLSGGGICSMVKVFFIVCISSCYSGMFQGTGLLDGARSWLSAVSRNISPFGGVLLTAIPASMISCNQTLTIMLTHQLCQDVENVPERMASHLENTAVVIAPLIPWSIAGAVPLASVNAPALCIVTGCYLYLLPAWNFAVSLYQHRPAS